MRAGRDRADGYRLSRAAAVDAARPSVDRDGLPAVE